MIDVIGIEELLDDFVPVVNKTLEKSRQNKGPGPAIDYEVIVTGKDIRSHGLLQQYHLILPRITRTSMVYVVGDENKCSDVLIKRSFNYEGKFTQFTETNKYSVSVYPSPEPKCGFCGHREYDATENSCGFCSNVKDYYKRFNIWQTKI